jgi:hypothetical protein
MLAPTATIVSTMFWIATVSADEPKLLIKLRQRFEALQHPNEADRVHYITAPVRLRESLTRADADKMKAIDAEIIKHPMPLEVDSAALRKRLVGRWRSPRHSYLYRADGTWTTSDFTDANEATPHGLWRIEGNKFFHHRLAQPSEAETGETIIILTHTDFVWSRHIALTTCDEGMSTRGGIKEVWETKICGSREGQLSCCPSERERGELITATTRLRRLSRAESLL